MPSTINLDLVRSADARLKRAKRINPNVTARPVPIEELVQRAALTVPELAAITNMHPLTIRRAIAAGELKAASNGAKGHYRITRADANAWWKGRGGSDLFPEFASVQQPKPKAARRAFGLLTTDPNATGTRTVDDFLADRRAEAQTELDKGAV